MSEFGTGMLCLLKKKKNKKNKKLDKIKMSKSSFRKKVLKTCFWFSADLSIFIEKRRRHAFGRPFFESQKRFVAKSSRKPQKGLPSTPFTRFFEKKRVLGDTPVFGSKPSA